MKQAAKIDATQPGIVAALRAAGWGVLSLAALGNGAPDLLVARHGCAGLIECKSRGGRLTDLQRAFAATWPGNVGVAYSPEEALDLVWKWEGGAA